MFADERIRRRERQRHAPRRKLLLHERRPPVPGCVHPHQHGTPRSARQGLLLYRRNRRKVALAGRRYRRHDEQERRLWHPRARLRRRKRQYQGRENHPELHRHRR